MIAIVDYGLGNVGSVLNMLRKVGARGRITGAAAEIDAADRLILPGIGHFGPGMRKLQATGLVPVLEAFVASGRPVLGICLGMQMMTRGSDESDVKPPAGGVVVAAMFGCVAKEDCGGGGTSGARNSSSFEPRSI